MPRFLRDYERQDFTELLNELQGVDEKDKVDVQSTVNDNGNVVDMFKRKRSSLMDNPKMLYAYSTHNRVLHDRDCQYVKDISDKHFRMSPVFVKNMRHCGACYRKSLIRNGVGDDRRRMVAYERFFNQLEVSNRDLYMLLIEHEAKLKWINNDVMQIHHKDDTWRIIRGACGLELWHNNYICLKDYTRHFTDGFHKQNVCESPTFHTLLLLMLNYSWECHVAQREKKLLVKVDEPVTVEVPIKVSMKPPVKAEDTPADAGKQAAKTVGRWKRIVGKLKKCLKLKKIYKN